MKKSWIIAFLIILIFVFLISSFWTEQTRNIFYKISYPIQKKLWDWGTKISSYFEFVGRFNTLKVENEKLKNENKELLILNAELEKIKKENEELKKLNDSGLASEFKLKIAEIVGKSIDQDYLIINVGKIDGITAGQVAITGAKALIGKITDVYNNFSIVELASEKESQIDVKILNKDIFCILKGKGRGMEFLDLVPKDKKLKEDDTVITSSSGGIFPEGLLIGKVKKVKNLDIEEWQQAEIDPFFNFNEKGGVFVILNFIGVKEKK